MNNEDELVEKALQGSHSAFESLLHPYRNMMLSLALRMTGDREDAQEVCQEAMMKIYKYLGKYQTGKRFKNWIYSIVAHSALDFLNGKKKITKLNREFISRQPDGEFSPEMRLLQREIKSRLKLYLGKLLPKERLVFLLRDVEGFSTKETAEILGGSLVSTRVHLSRARQKLRAQLKNFHPEIEVKE
jgi:RNA polymerase sigma-70 factor (ECF subfamily)